MFPESATAVPCCADVPAGGPLLRYALAELLRGLGLAPTWTRRDDARIVMETGGAQEPESPLPAGDPSLRGRRSQGQSLPRTRSGGEGVLRLAVTPAALGDLDAPRQPDAGDLGRLDVDGEPWPVPVGPPGAATLGDAVAGAAWWLAGLQEVAVTERDHHGRFPYDASLQAALGGAPGGPLRPAVDATRRALADALRATGLDVTGRTWGGAPWAVALTHDLDAARTRRLRAGFGSLARGAPIEAARRALGPDRRRQSVHDLRALGQRHGADATWFVKPGAWTPHDVPGSLDEALADTLRQMRAEVGWHPGYGVHGHPERWDTERDRFEAAFGAPPRLARTHFLRWTEPETPRALDGRGVRVDSTLGFAEHEGFRRGTALPFRLFDVARGAPSDLWEVPLAVMDTTLAGYRQRSGPALADALDAVFGAARASGGVAVVLWHNQVGGDTAAWRTRLDALDHALGRARAGGAVVGPLGPLLQSWQGPPS